MATDSVAYSPSSLVSIFNAATVISEEKRIIKVRGILIKEGRQLYAGNYYNRLRDESSENTITLVTPQLYHNQLSHNETIEIQAFVTRRVIAQYGRIELLLNLVDVVEKHAPRFSETDLKSLGILNRKISEGFKDLDLLIKDAVFRGSRLKVAVIQGVTAIIDKDIKDALGEGISLYNISFHKVNLTCNLPLTSYVQN